MQSAIQRVGSFEELLKIEEDGPYVFGRMFSADGWRARRRSKRRLKLLRKIDEPLREMLRDDERVFFVTSGVLHPSFLEWYFLGVVLYYMSRRAIVLTNQRILLIQIDSRKRPGEMRNEIAYTAVARLKNSWMGNTRIDFHNGDRVLLTRVSRADRKWLAEILEWFTERLEVPSADSALENLCPHCYVTVRGHPSTCTACGGAFKSPRRAASLSLVYPGAGDLYLGHNVFAVLELLGATLIWGVLIVTAWDPAVRLGGALIAIGIVVLFFHGIDALTTRHIARKGLIRDSGSPRPWHFALAGVVPLIAVASVVLAEPGKLGLEPLPVAVAGTDLSDRHVTALREAGYVEPDERVRYFYSEGPVSVLQDGNLFTDDRIVSYQKDFDVDFHASARFDEVVDLRVVPPAPGDSLTRVFVVPPEDEPFFLIVRAAEGGDTLFAQSLADRWRSVRSGSPGFWFDGGNGASIVDAVILRGLGETDDVEAIERWWLTTWLGLEGTDWTLVDRWTVPFEEDEVDYVTVQYADDTRGDYVFRRPGRVEP